MVTVVGRKDFRGGERVSPWKHSVVWPAGCVGGVWYCPWCWGARAASFSPQPPVGGAAEHYQHSARLPDQSVWLLGLTGSDASAPSDGCKENCASCRLDYSAFSHSLEARPNWLLDSGMLVSNSRFHMNGALDKSIWQINAEDLKGYEQLGQVFGEI